MSVDGVHLRLSWNAALNDAQSRLQALLNSATSTQWRRISTATQDTGPETPPNVPDDANIVIHKRSSKQGDIFRLVHDIPAENFSIDAWKAVITTPEMRQEWDPAVESSQLLEIFDVDVRITKTYFTLGWPANPRDAITISRTLNDGATLLDVTTSLPRSPDEPPYLRPTPPYVRSHIHLFAWVIQQIPAQSGAKIRLTCFWQHDLKAVWGMGTPSRAQHLCSIILGAVNAVKKYGLRIPMLRGFGIGIGMERMAFDVGRQSLQVEYSIIEEQETDGEAYRITRGMDDIQARRERRRLERSVEFTLPKKTSWDVQMVSRAPSQKTPTPWSVNVYRETEDDQLQGQLLLRTRHGVPPSSHTLIKFKLVIEAAGGTAGNLRLNGTPHPIEILESREPATSTIQDPLFHDASAVGSLNFSDLPANSSSFADDASRTTSTRSQSGRTEASQKSILKLVRRNYVYFASLLQEPEVKWKPMVEARGVTITQLDSIDPTLVVYRAEAVFVGVTVWDLISVVSTPGATIYWDKAFDGATLVEDVSELSELWHFKTKATWPINARESVLLKSTYKSPTSVHVFSFSVDDSQLFPGIPQTDPSVIRTQVDLRGWAIEALSPTTTQVTLIEQSDPKGWSNKSSLPQQMIAAVSGVGEFAIKCGGPPMVSRLGGARALVNRYDHEKGVFRLEYEGDTSRNAAQTPQNSTPSVSVPDLEETLNSPSPPPSRPFVECELRCDIETWGGPIDLVIDPPPQNVSCLRRHRLSDNGGGLWITIEHDADFVMGERLRAVVRKGAVSTAKDRNSVYVNGSKAKIEVEELADSMVKLLSKKRRIKPIRIPLDQPPVISAIQRRRAEWAADAEVPASPDSAISVGFSPLKPSSPSRPANAFSRFMTLAVSQATTSTSAAMTAVAKPFALTEQTVPTSNKLPMQHALDALTYLRTSYTRPSQEGWQQVADTSGLVVYKKLETEVSRTIPVHKGSKVIEGVTAEEIANILTSYDCRKQWDDRFDSATILQDFGYGCQTSFTVIKGAFPFQPRGFYTASVLARAAPEPPSSPSQATRGNGLLTPSTEGGRNPIYYCATASFNPESVNDFNPSKYNPSGYAVGRVHLRGWILETLDPYTAENYTIPSTRCTFVSSVDFAGAVPAAYNAMLNASLPRAIVRLESYLKAGASLPFLYTPSIGIAIESHEGPQEGWSFQRKDSGQRLARRKFVPEKKELYVSVLIEMSPPENPLSTIDETTPTPSKIIPIPVPSPTRLEAFPRPRYTSLSPPGSYEPEKEEMRPHSPERDSLRKRSALKANSLTAASSGRRKPLPSFSQRDQIAQDYIIADVVVDSKLFSGGFEIRINSRTHVSEEPMDMSPGVRGTSNSLPITTTVFALPTTLFKDSHSETSGNRHLLRLTLPTARFEAPAIEDPLTGQIRSAPPRPPWLVELMERSAVVDISIVALPDLPPSPEKSPSRPYKVLVDGTQFEIVPERRSLIMLAKSNDNGELKLPWLARSDDAVFPKQLTEPIAIAKDYLADPIPLVSSPITDDQSSKVSGEPPATRADENAPKPSTPPPRPGMVNLLSSYMPWWARKTPSTASLQVKGPVVTASDVDKPSPAPSAEEIAASEVQHLNRHLHGRGVSIPTVLIIGLICFLLGSLVRSILSPTDFVIVKNHDELTDLDDHLGWRRLTRLVELKYLFRGNDLIIGIAHA